MSGFSRMRRRFRDRTFVQACRREGIALEDFNEQCDEDLRGLAEGRARLQRILGRPVRLRMVMFAYLKDVDLVADRAFDLLSLTTKDERCHRYYPHARDYYYLRLIEVYRKFRRRKGYSHASV